MTAEVASSAGVLVLVATPIGNLGDLSTRAVDELGRADAIACEDTRRTGRLLAGAEIVAPPLVVVNDHSETRQVAGILARLSEGQRVAVVSDAGTPVISDPGSVLVAAAAEAGYRVEIIPGPSAVTAAVALSGLPSGRFCFEGFLPRKGAGRTARLAELAGERRMLVLYEAPHRLARTLSDLAEALGGSRRVAVARELTKLHEEVWRGTLDGAVEWARTGPKGEHVLVVDGAPAPEPPADETILDALSDAMAGGASRRDAAASVAAALGVSRNRVYDLATGTH
jgi:16S rRNA (cytidine1402-2'-O)-methyltransferase